MKSSMHVLPFYIPPTLLVKQAMALGIYKIVSSWRGIDWWTHNIIKLCKIVAGAVGIGCFGYPIHPVYEVTSNCNLHCFHCHARGGEQTYEELDTDKAKVVIKNLAAVREFRTLVFTGGEPLVRKDIYKLLNYASSLGFYTVLATNATLITKDVAQKLKKANVEGIAASIDFIDPAQHDVYRGASGAFKAALKGIANAQQKGMYIQINITVSRRNLTQLEDLLKLADRLRAHAVLLYQLIPFGRGESLLSETLDSKAFVKLMVQVRNIQKWIKPVIIPVGLPEHFVFLAQSKKLNLAFASKAFKGCIAGRGMFYIKPNGDVWPCPFLPLKAGNLLKNSSIEIWKSSIFNLLRNRKNLKGYCGECKYANICGGCRARAYAYTKDPFASDPICLWMNDKYAS
jgi:radical SAM protein with 4Fe4S-binding SPASM domain